MKSPHRIALSSALLLVTGLGLFFATSRRQIPEIYVPATTPPQAMAVAKAFAPSTVSMPPANELRTELPPAIQSLLDQLAALAAPPDAPEKQPQIEDLLCRLAVLRGNLAMEALFKLSDQTFQQQIFGGVLSAWADGDPLAALQWFHAPARDALVGTAYVAPPDFHEKCFCQLAAIDSASAAASLRSASFLRVSFSALLFLFSSSV